jgi:hypothetical protein
MNYFPFSLVFLCIQYENIDLMIRVFVALVFIIIFRSC